MTAVQPRSRRSLPGDRVRAALDACPLLAPAPPDRRDALARAGWLRGLADGEVACWTDDPADAVFVVVSGRVAARLSSADGAAIDMAVVGAGTLFGYPELLAGAGRSCDAVAVGPTTVAVLPGAAFRALLDACPAVLLEVARELAAIVSQQARAAHQRAFRPATSRVAAWLDAHAAAGWVRLDEPQAALARRLGISRQTLSRALRDLADPGIVRVHRGGRAVEIVDRDRLREAVAAAA